MRHALGVVAALAVGCSGGAAADDLRGDHAGAGGSTAAGSTAAGGSAGGGHAGASGAPPTCIGCFVEVAAGAFHTCARADDGRVACWGSNSAGQIGAETVHEETLSPREASPLWVPGVEGAVSLGLGRAASCAALATGKVVCWGSGRDLSLGSPQDCGPDPTAPCRVLSPVEVPGVVEAVQVVAGDAHACARTAGGQVWCWGRNDHGETGFAPAPLSPLQAPAPVAGVVAVRLFARAGITCALGAGGDLTCWGDRVTACAPTTPTLLASGVVDVAFGAGDLCVLAAGGSVRCRGANLGGELGAIVAPFSCDKNDKWTDDLVEVATSGAAVAGLDASMCVWSDDGALRCFGSSLPPASTSLADVGTLPAARSMQGGAGHLVWLGADGRAGALGSNWYGQLGSGEAYSTDLVMAPVWVTVGAPR